MQMDQKIENARMAGAAVGVTIYGLTLNEWVAVATIAYMLVQIVLVSIKIYKHLEKPKEPESCEKKS